MPKLSATLGDALDAGINFLAICHNVPCRYSQIVNLALVIEHVGARHSLIPVKGKVHFSERMRCPQCKSAGMFIATKNRQDPEPFLNGMGYVINNWDKETDNLISDVSVAHAAFAEAIQSYPGRRITLQEGGFVLRDSRLKVIEGGR